MTTLAELKTQAAALLADPSLKTFDTTDLGYFINAGIAQVSRVSPQKFLEDVTLTEDTLAYVLHGGDGNLVANPSFETGDDTVLVEGVAYFPVVGPGDSSLLGGWEPSASGMIVGYQRNGYAKTGARVGTIWFPTGHTSEYLYQDIPVNPGTTYYVSGWHWNDLAGGDVFNRVEFDTLDDASVVVGLNVVQHITTAATPQAFSGSIPIPDDDTVSFIRVRLYAVTVGTSPLNVALRFEDISISEDATSGVAANQRDSIEVVRCEIWSSNYDPARKIGSIVRGRGDSESGYEYWDGMFHIPFRVLSALDTATNYLRVYGYGPYDKLTSETQVTDLSFELEQAVMEYVRLQALERLLGERDLFTQWQTRSGNTDVSPASLMSTLSQARDAWRRTRRDILVLREGH